MKFFKTPDIFLFFLVSFSGFSQVKLTSYSIYSLGVSLPVIEKFSAELKVFANRGNLEDTGIELNGTYKFKPGRFPST